MTKIKLIQMEKLVPASVLPQIRCGRRNHYQ